MEEPSQLLKPRESRVPVTWPARFGKQHGRNTSQVVRSRADFTQNDDQNVGGGVISPSLESLIDRLTSLETPMSPDAASDLISTYGEQPVHAWLDVLEHDPTVRSVPALLIHKLRAGETPPLKPPRKQRHGSNRGYSSQRGRVVTLEEMPQVEMEEPLPLP